jgi:hypothetical protein
VPAEIGMRAKLVVIFITLVFFWVTTLPVYQISSTVRSPRANKVCTGNQILAGFSGGFASTCTHGLHLACV